MDGFVVLKVKYNNESSVVRDIYIKEHKVRESSAEKPIGRTLLVANVPPFVDDLCVRHVFNSCGKIVNLLFHLKPTSGPQNGRESKYFDWIEDINGYKVCYVVFAKRTALLKALKLNKSPQVLTLRPEECEQHLNGLKAMKQKYNESIVDSNELQKEINEFMAEYDKRVEEERLRDKESAGIPDEEGWVKVKRHSKRRHLPNNDSNDKRISEKHNKRRKKSSTDLKNFYSFQVKESKIEYLMELRNRFEEDKRRIAVMKAQRKFRPF